MKSSSSPEGAQAGHHSRACRPGHRFATGSSLLLALVALIGCRAFEPETVVVNKPPETYIIGAPVEEGGGYYHYHVYWYGSDQDGRVERFVWALTDTTVQDEDTTEDEEDVRFNPALDANHLRIAHWTTRTDSIFDFQINLGSLTSARMTLHMVAQDDFGDFDRTPARLLFFSNALGNPTISFYRVDQNPAGNDTVSIALGHVDTVGFGKSYLLTWRGSTPNIRGYDPEALELVDNVEPRWDGLLGYQWLIQGELGDDRGWYPKKPLPASSDSFAYFGNVTSLYFRNDGTGSDPFHKNLGSSLVGLLVNSIDVAGVEVLAFEQQFNFIVNYDPETRILNYETDYAHPGAPDADQVYPYYVRLNELDPTGQTQPPHYPFRMGDRIPDRTYVVVKALMRDDPRDERRPGSTYRMGLEGFVRGVRQNVAGGTFSFATETSLLDTLPAWDEGLDGWYADTLGFLVGPRSDFTMSLVAVDEHLRRDGTPARLSFSVGYPPCIQCVELTPPDYGSAYADSVIDCNFPSCFGDTTVLFAADTASAPPHQKLHLESSTDELVVHKTTGSIKLIPEGEAWVFPVDTYYHVPASRYRMEFLLHGLDDELERFTRNEILVNPYFNDYGPFRMMGWRYQVDYDCDIYGSIQDGGGIDNITQATYGWVEDDNFDGGVAIDPTSGLWKLRVDIGVPTFLVFLGPTIWYNLLVGDPTIPPGAADLIFKACTMQIGHGQLQIVGLDQTSCDFSPRRPARYNIFRKVRPETVTPVSSWRTCQSSNFADRLKISIPIEQGAMESNGGTPVVKHFKIVVRTNAGANFVGYESCSYEGQK